MSAGVGALVERVGSADGGQIPAELSQFLTDRSWGSADGGGVEQGVPVGPVAALGEVAAGCAQERFQLMPARVAAGGGRLADAGRAIAQADVTVTADRGSELGEPAVFFGDDEVSVVGRQLRAGQFGIREGRFHERGELISPLVLRVPAGLLLPVALESWGRLGRPPGARPARPG